MKLIDFFAKYIKPIRFKGTGLLHPSPSQQITEKLFVVKQFDVNYFLYRTENDNYIAIDSGYFNFDDPIKELEKLNIDRNKVVAMFLTHADCDHAGGIADNGPDIFPNAKIYLLDKEEKMIIGEERRFRRGPFKIKNPLKCSKPYILLKNHDVLEIEGVKIEILSIPGHTLGHSVYLLDDKFLFTGDSIAIDHNSVGYCFFSFFNMNTDMLKNSLYDLKTFVSEKKPEIVLTSHNGFTKNTSRLFEKMDECPKGNKRHPFDITAPNDIFHDY